MTNRRIPALGAEISLVTLGTMTFGSPVQAKDAAELVRYAVQRGINSIDTANMYEGYSRTAGSAGGVAEEILGTALAGGLRKRVVLATKLGMAVGTAPEDEGTSAAAIRAQLPRSLARLQTDYIDIYYLHKPGRPEQLEDTLREMNRARREGAIRGYGVSNYSAGELAGLLELAAALGLPPPVACQPPLSLLKPQAAKELLPLCEGANIAVLPYQIYQGGLLTGKYTRGGAPPAGSRGAEKPEWLPPPDEALHTRLEQLHAEAGKESMALPEYALCWVLRQPAVASAIVGVKSKQQVDAAIQAAARL